MRMIFPSPGDELDLLQLAEVYAYPASTAASSVLIPRSIAAASTLSLSQLPEMRIAP